MKMNTKKLSLAIVLITHSGCYLIFSSNFIHFNKFCGTIILWKYIVKWNWNGCDGRIGGCKNMSAIKSENVLRWTAVLLIIRVHTYCICVLSCMYNMYKIMHLNCCCVFYTLTHRHKLVYKCVLFKWQNVIQILRMQAT